MGKILGLAYVFPPGDSVANRRFINYVKTFKSIGYDTYVISSSESLYIRRGISINRSSPFPYEVRGERVCSSSPARLEKACWTLSSFFRGLAYSKKESIKAVFATGDPWFVIVAGALISVFSGKPFIADIRDPWSVNPFIRRGGSARFVEKLCLRRASAVFVTTESVRELYMKSFPEFAEKIFTVKNGIDLEQFGKIEKLKFEWKDNERFSLLFSGNITPLREPALETFFAGLASCSIEEKSKIRTIFYTSAPEVILKAALRHSAEQSVSVNAFVPLKTLLSAISSSDACLLLDYSILENATKLIEYISSSRTVFAVIPGESSNAKLIEEYGAGIVCSIEKGKDAVTEGLKKILSMWKSDRLPVAPAEKSRDFLFSASEPLIKKVLEKL